MGKETELIEHTVCDICGKRIDHQEIKICGICGKEICLDCGDAIDISFHVLGHIRCGLDFAEVFTLLACREHEIRGNLNVETIERVIKQLAYGDVI